MKRTAMCMSMTAFMLVAGPVRGDSLNVRFIGRCPTPGMAMDIAVSGDYAYLACQADTVGLRVASVADPTHPSLVGSCHTPEHAWRVAVNGDHAYIADWEDGLRVISVSDPTHPVEVGYVNAPGGVRDVAVAGDYAYVACEESGLAVISVVDPAHPTVVGSCDTPGFAYGVAATDSFAYVADWDSGMRVISIADPAHPVEVGHLDTSGIAIRVSVKDRYAYVVDNSIVRVWVLSVADPAHPAWIGSYDLPMPAFANCADVVGSYLYVGVPLMGIRVASVADPQQPLEVGHYSEYMGPYGMSVANGYVYVATVDQGLMIYQFYGDGVEEKSGPPASRWGSGATVVRNLPKGVVAFDATGRHVPNPRSGIYFVRDEPQAQSRGPLAIRRVVLTQ